MSTYLTWAPKCTLPGCNNKVHYHKKTLKEDGTPSYKWKTFCEFHRSVEGKKMVEIFKKSRGGCENRDARLGRKCLDPDTPSLTVDHWDGDRYNNDQDNLVILCANCHQEKTKLYKDHRNRYKHSPSTFDDLFEVY